MYLSVILSQVFTFIPNFSIEKKGHELNRRYLYCLNLPRRNNYEKKLFCRRPGRENPRTLVLVLHRHGLWAGPDHVLCWGEKLHRKTWRSSKSELLHVQQHGSSNDDQVDCPSIHCLNKLIVNNFKFFRIGHYYFDNKPMIGKMADINVWSRFFHHCNIRLWQKADVMYIMTIYVNHLTEEMQKKHPVFLPPLIYKRPPPKQNWKSEQV